VPLVHDAPSLVEVAKPMSDAPAVEEATELGGRDDRRAMRVGSGSTIVL
jgi:hypothetical protein